MFAALTIVRMRQAVIDANLEKAPSWLSDDSVKAMDLPLAKAVEKVLASMHTVLDRTKAARDKIIEDMAEPLENWEKETHSEERMHLRKTRAAEIQIIRNVKDLREPGMVFKAHPLDV